MQGKEAVPADPFVSSIPINGCPATMNAPSSQLTSRIDDDGTLRVWLETVDVQAPGPGEVLIEVAAAPIHPSDLRLLVGPVDPGTLRDAGTHDAPMVEGRVPAQALAGLRHRLNKPMPVGSEGAGVVVAAGSGCEELMGRTVAFSAPGGAYTTRRRVNASDCLVFEAGTEPRSVAAAFVNPLTVLCMVHALMGTAHSAIVHTAAASSVGQMLSRLCMAERIPLVNIVRTPAQASLLREQGANWVVDSSAADFPAALTQAIRETGATLAFDAIGGGRMASTILTSMGRAQRENTSDYSPYGSPVLKQVFNYGLLDPGPRIIEASVGTAWSVAGWLMVWELARLERSTVDRFRARIARDIHTIFRTRFEGAFSLGELLTADAIRECMKRATNRKYLVTPNQ